MTKLSELVIKPQNITPEKVKKYYKDNIWDNDNEFGASSDGWKEYINLKNKYGYFHDLSILIKNLSQQDLKKFYQDMRALVRKYVGKEILSELQITPRNINREKVHQYFWDNIATNRRYNWNGNPWKEYTKLRDKYGYFHTKNLINNLPQPDLNRFYQEMRALVRKYVGTEILNELQITPHITPEKVWKFYYDNIYNNKTQFHRSSNNWEKYLELCEPYCDKNGILWYINTIQDFKKLSQPELNNLYQDMLRLVHKSKLHELQITPQNTINKIKHEDIKIWKAKTSTPYYKEDELVAGIKIFNKYLYCLSPKIQIDNNDDENYYLDNKYIVFDINHFELKPEIHLGGWYDSDLDLTYEPITLNNIYLLR